MPSFTKVDKCWLANKHIGRLKTKQKNTKTKKQKYKNYGMVPETDKPKRNCNISFWTFLQNFYLAYST